MAPPGYNDGGEGQRIVYLGSDHQVADTTETIRRFLDAMPFASPADRTNTLGAALIVRLRNRWAGEKPIVQITANKSHAGKGTTTDFICGRVPKADLLYQALDWPLQSQLQKQVRANPEIGVIVMDNARIDTAGGHGKIIRSAFVESFATNREITLASPGAGEPIHLVNKFVVVINTNDGALGDDLINRSLPIRLEATGDVHTRTSGIGNPKLEFLPANQGRIEAELNGMFARWTAAGCPLDEDVRHPMGPCTRTIGGILKENGFIDFLANQHVRRTADDPIREALGILAAAKPGEPLRPANWASVAVEEGLAKKLFSPADRDTLKGQERAIGVVFSRHLEETFNVHKEENGQHVRLRLQLRGGARRWVAGEHPHTRYIFTVLEREEHLICE